MPTVQETIAALLETDTQLAGLKAKRERLRDELAAEARRRWEADGAVPSWKAARLGTVTLAGTESVSAEVADQEAFAEWAVQERTESATLTLTLPAVALTGQGMGNDAEAMERADAVGELLVTATRAGAKMDWHVHPGVLDGLVKHGRTDPDTGQLWSEEGDVVPGVVVRRKEPFLQVRLDPEAKRRAVAEVEAADERAQMEAQGVADALAFITDTERRAVADVERETFTGEGAAAIEAAEAEVPPMPERGTQGWYEELDAVFGES